MVPRRSTPSLSARERSFALRGQFGAIDPISKMPSLDACGRTSVWRFRDDLIFGLVVSRIRRLMDTIVLAACVWLLPTAMAEDFDDPVPAAGRPTNSSCAAD